MDWGAWYYPDPDTQLELHSVLFVFGVPFADDHNLRVAELGFRTKPDDAGVEMQDHFVRLERPKRVLYNGGDPKTKLLEY